MTRRGPPKNRGGLSGEDETLWAQVTRDVVPSKLRKKIQHAEGTRPERAPAQRAHSPGSAPPQPVHSGPAPKRSAKLSELEPRATRRIAKGRDEIEARVDLHGLRQDEAHRVLRSFALRCHANGLRTVLVITGKGAPRDVAPDTPFELFQNRDRGVLKRNVPRWLAEPDLRSIVAGYTTAHVRHGGEGALYVRLRGGNRG